MTFVLNLKKGFLKKIRFEIYDWKVESSEWSKKNTGTLEQADEWYGSRWHVGGKEYAGDFIEFVEKEIKKLEKVSGQNPIEAAKLGCKIYHGPYVYNFKEIYDLLKSYKISEEVNNEKDLYEKLNRDLKNLENDEGRATNIINDMGKKILDGTTKEINKLLF